MDSLLGTKTLNPQGKFCWEVDSSSNHGDSIVMDTNELAGEWKYPDTAMMLAVRLQTPFLPQTTSDTGKIVTSIIVKFDTSSNRTGVSDTFNIKWGWFKTANHDTAFFSPLYTSALLFNFQI